MKTGEKIFIIIAVIVGLSALAYVIIKLMKKPSSGVGAGQGTGLNSGAGSYSSGSGSGMGSGTGPTGPTNPNPPTAPEVNPVGMTAIAKDDGTVVYNASPFSVYKTASKNEWIGKVLRTYAGAYYLIDDGNTPNKLAFINQVYLS